MFKDPQSKLEDDSSKDNVVPPFEIESPVKPPKKKKLEKKSVSEYPNTF
jgi:hypothetical protein